MRNPPFGESIGKSLMRVQVDHDHSDLQGYVYRGDIIGSIPLDGYLGTLIVAGNADIYIYYKYIIYIYIN